MKSPSWESPSSPMVWSSEIGLPGVLLDLQHLLRGDVHLLGELLGGGLAPEVLEQLTLDAAELVDHLDHVHGDADRAGLVGHRAGDRLADPPRRVGGELVALRVVELLDRADQAQVALLDQVQERHAAPGVALGQRDDQPQVRLEQVVLGALAVADDPLEVAPHLRRDLLARVDRPAQPLGGVEAGLDPLGELDLLLRVEQRHLADLLEVRADRVGRRGELGVLAGLPQRLGLLFVPDEVARLLGARRALADAGAAAVRAGVGRLVLVVLAPRRRRPRRRGRPRPRRRPPGRRRRPRRRDRDRARARRRRPRGPRPRARRRARARRPRGRPARPGRRGHRPGPWSPAPSRPTASATRTGSPSSRTTWSPVWPRSSGRPSRRRGRRDGQMLDRPPRRRSDRCVLRSLRLPPRPSRCGALCFRPRLARHRSAAIRSIGASPRRPPCCAKSLPAATPGRGTGSL